MNERAREHGNCYDPFSALRLLSVHYQSRMSALISYYSTVCSSVFFFSPWGPLFLQQCSSPWHAQGKPRGWQYRRSSKSNWRTRTPLSQIAHSSFSVWRLQLELYRNCSRCKIYTLPEETKPRFCLHWMSFCVQRDCIFPNTRQRSQRG